MSPESVFIILDIHFKKVVLPEPLRPSNATSFPESIVQDMSSNTLISENDLLRFLISNII